MRTANGDLDGSGTERSTVTFETVDLAEDEAKVRFVREVVAVMNDGGGRVVVGLDRSGREVGIADAEAEALTSPAIASAVDDYIAPDSVRLEARPRSVGGGRSVVEIEVGEAVELPAVFTVAGTYRTGDGSEAALFAVDDIVVRRGGRTRAANRDDHRRFTARAVDRERARLVEHLSMAIEAPAGSTLRLLTDDEVRDDPSYFLTRSTDLFCQRRERVLEGGDLQYLWLHRASLTPGRSGAELLVQSALRKRATLFLWLTVLDLPPAALKAQLWAALDMRDRDKSDAARSILQVAALIADQDDYAALRQALATADYSHMRSAAELWPTRADARESLTGGGDRSLRTHSEAALLALADEIVRAGGSAVLRQAPLIGLELFRRKLERSVRA